MRKASPGSLSIGALSRRTGCNIETIRYYERIGVMAEPPRTAGGHRAYGWDDLKRLRFVRRCRTLGFTLEKVRELLKLADGHDDTCAQVKAITVAHAADVREKIGDLRRLERVLDEMAAKCDGGAVPDCPVIDALFDGEPVANP